MTLEAIKKFIMEVIKIYKSLLCLWKVKSVEYQNKDAIDNAFDQMTDKFRKVDEHATKSYCDVKVKYFEKQL